MTIGVAVVTFLAGRVSVAPLVTMISTSRRTNSAARSGRRLFLPSAYRYSMTMFCPSIHPRSRSPCWNALCQGTVSEAENGERMPIRAIFFGCCAAADEQSARSMAHRVRTVIFLFMFFPALFIRHLSLAPLLLDNLVRSHQHIGRDRKADLLGGF